MSDHNKQKKIAVINDFTGFGRCSLTVEIPIISAMHVQCCPIPTSVLSNHTAYDRYFLQDMTDSMEPYIEEWKLLDLQFSGIATGYLSSLRQFTITEQFIDDFKRKDTIVEVDPVMADGGQFYDSYSPEMCQAMRHLLTKADLITPNLTEACFLTDTPYHAGSWRIKELHQLTEKLHRFGPEKIVITGIPQGQFVANICSYDDIFKVVRSHRIGISRSGTGDVFASILIADAVRGIDFESSVRKAARFLKRCLIRSDELGIPKEDGVCFEEFLTKLK
ncbi:MAG: pyridoxamine kinase [Catenisphaera adipataccumulans]|uniref:pyridoxamine kinase n=1 Tax=Catenisphaera adipataccumulans TaxID=700500 RepID=UPI003D92D9EC